MSLVDRVFLEDMMEEDNVELMIDIVGSDVLDEMMEYDESTGTYDPDSGLLFPQPIKEVKLYD